MIASIISQTMFRVLLRLAFIFEPLAPKAITYYLSRRLRELKNQGLISRFKARTRRLGKFHYKIEIDLDLSSHQAFHFLREFLPGQISILRRWFNV